jgi:hypothetical protein
MGPNAAYNRSVTPAPHPGLEVHDQRRNSLTAQRKALLDRAAVDLALDRQLLPWRSLQQHRLQSR